METRRPNDSLREYKNLNTYITWWLVCSARDRHCPNSLLKPAASNHYIINTTSFVPLAEWIESASPAVQVPKSVLACLDRVIDLRTRHGEERRGPGAPTAQDMRHVHFINVLQDVRTILRRLPIAAAESQSGPRAEKRAAPNRFGAFDTAEVSDDTEQDGEGQGMFIPPIAWHETSVQVVDNTTTSIEEGLFEFNLLLEDLRSLEATVAVQWDLYVDGKRDLAAVAVITNMAFLLAKEMEKQVRDSLRGILEGQDDQKQATARSLINRLGISKSAAASVLDGNPYFAFYFSLLQKPVDSSNEEIYEIEERTYYNTFKTFAAWHTNVCFMPNRTANFLRVGEGQYGSHTYKGHWDALPVQERREKSRAFLMETLPDLHFVGRLSKDRAPVQDNLSSAIFQSVEGRTVDVSTVFALQLLLYIRNKLHDAGKLGDPVATTQKFLRSSTTALSALDPVLPTNQSRESLRPTYQHLVQVQDDIFRVLKTGIHSSGVVTTTPFFTLTRSPVLCGMLLHAERVLAQDAALAAEKTLGGLTAAVHLGHAFTTEGLIRDLGNLAPTVRAQGDSAFFLGGKRPTITTEYLPSYAMAIGRSVVSAAPSSSQRRSGGAGGAGASLAARKSKLELSPPAPFSRLVQARQQDPHGRFSLTEGDLVGLLVGSGNPMMKKIYGESAGSFSSSSLSGASRKPPAPVSPLQHAALLLHAEVPTLEHDYVSSVRVAWQALRAVQAALGGPREGLELGAGSRGRGGRGGRGGRRAAGASREQEERSVDSAEVLVGRVFGGVANEDLMQAAGKAYADAVSVGDS